MRTALKSSNEGLQIGSAYLDQVCVLVGVPEEVREVKRQKLGKPRLRICEIPGVEKEEVSGLV
jgi:hypothetical protein